LSISGLVIHTRTPWQNCGACLTCIWDTPGKTEKSRLYKFSYPDYPWLWLCTLEWCPYRPGHRNSCISGPGCNRCSQFWPREQTEGIFRLSVILKLWNGRG
jgi:hypothetical protein